MTRNYSPLYPDCLSGALCAFEGLRGAIALLNGPTGCKYYNSYLIDRQDSAGFSFDPVPFGEKFYFGQPRVPASAVEGEDYVYGTGPKMRQLLEHIKSRRGVQLLGIVNSPGPTLIGDDLRREVEAAGIRQPVVYIESPGFSNRWADGYQKAMVEILKRIDYEGTRKPQVASQRSAGHPVADTGHLQTARSDRQRSPSDLRPATFDLRRAIQVNLIGFMIGQHNWIDDLNEVRRMIELLGLCVNVNVGSGETVENLSRIPSAKYNLIMSEEYGSDIGSYLEERFSIPSLTPETLTPYGIDATEVWARTIGERFNVDFSHFNKEVEAVRRKCYSALSRIASVRGVPRGVRFAIFGDGYQVAPLSFFLYRYLGMYPAIIGLRECGPVNRRFLEEFIAREKLNEARVMESPNQAQIAEALRRSQPEIVLGSNFEERILAAELSDSSFIGISFPIWNRFQLSERPLVGLRGVLVIVEEILNSLSRKTDLPE